MFNADTILGTSILVPFRRAGRDIVSGSGLKAIESSVRQILSTEKGELPWNPDFGINSGKLRHRNINPVFLDELEADVLLALNSYEPRANVTAVETRQDTADPSIVKVTVRFQALARSVMSSSVITEETSVDVVI